MCVEGIIKNTILFFFFSLISHFCYLSSSSSIFSPLLTFSLLCFWSTYFLNCVQIMWLIFIFFCSRCPCYGAGSNWTLELNKALIDIINAIYTHKHTPSWCWWIRIAAINSSKVFYMSVTEGHSTWVLTLEGLWWPSQMPLILHKHGFTQDMSMPKIHIQWGCC
jgi:hypothetical protein